MQTPPISVRSAQIIVTPSMVESQVQKPPATPKKSFYTKLFFGYRGDKKLAMTKGGTENSGGTSITPIIFPPVFFFLADIAVLPYGFRKFPEITHIFY